MLKIASTKRVADIIQFVRIIEAQVRRPPLIRLDQLKIYFSHELTLLDEFRAMFLSHFILLIPTTIFLYLRRWP
jgi:hypothetical protein